MDISDNLRCLFSAQIEQRDGTYLIEIPKQELRLGTIQKNEAYRVALFQGGPGGANTGTESERVRSPSGPPVAEGELREVEIEDLGDQGDGIARVERGYVVIVPETEPGERATVEIREVRDNVAFATVEERQTHIQ